MLRLADSRRRRGETIVETLTALLIITISFVSLTTAIVTSHRLTSAAQARDRVIRAQQSAASLQSAPDALGAMTFTDAKDGKMSVDVGFYGGADIASYLRNNTGETYNPDDRPDKPDPPAPSGGFTDHEGNDEYTLTESFNWEQFVERYYDENYQAIMNFSAGTLIKIGNDYYATTTLKYFSQTRMSKEDLIRLANDPSRLTTAEAGVNEPLLVKVDMSTVYEYEDDIIREATGWPWESDVHMHSGSLVYYQGQLWVWQEGLDTYTPGNISLKNGAVNGHDQYTRTRLYEKDYDTTKTGSTAIGSSGYVLNAPMTLKEMYNANIASAGSMPQGTIILDDDGTFYVTNNKTWWAASNEEVMSRPLSYWVGQGHLDRVDTSRVLTTEEKDGSNVTPGMLYSDGSNMYVAINTNGGIWWRPLDSRYWSIDAAEG